MMPTPHYVTTDHGQLRMWVAGVGAPLVALAGPTRSARSIADELGQVLPERTSIVVEPPGCGGSARLAGASIDEFAAVIDKALEFLHASGQEVDLVAFELAAVLLPGVAQRLQPRRTCVVGIDDACGWAAAELSPPEPDATASGSHLVDHWVFLRDRRLLRADDATLPRTAGQTLPDVDELNDGFVAAATDPAVFRRFWNLAVDGLPEALRRLPAIDRVEQLADLTSVLTGGETAGGAPVVPPTVPAPGTDLWHDYVDTAVGRAHLRRAGSSGKPLLVLSTGGGSSAQFEPVVRGLADGRTVAALDYFGNGLSDHPDGPADVDQLTDEALAVVDALGWTHFDVWGSHTGACVALEIAIRAPERVGKAVLEAPVMVHPDFRDDLLANYFPDLTPDRFGSHLAKVWNWRRDGFMYWPWYRVEHGAGRAIGVPTADDLHLYAIGILESGATYGRAYRAAFGYDTRSRLPHLTRPAILTAGPHDMLSNALEDATDLVPHGLLRTVATPATVWWPDPEPAAAEATMNIYREFLK